MISLRPAAAPTRDYERLAQTLAAYHYLAFACLMLPHALASLELHNRL